MIILQKYLSFQYAEAATTGVLCKKVFLEISQYSPENTCAKVSFLIKLQPSGVQLYQKRDSGISLPVQSPLLEHVGNMFTANKEDTGATPLPSCLILNCFHTLFLCMSS